MYPKTVEAGIRGESQAACFLGRLQQIDSMKNVLYGVSGLRQQGTLFNKAGNDPFDQGNLGVLETLKAPAVELEAENTVICIKCYFDHLQDA